MWKVEILFTALYHKQTMNIKSIISLCAFLIVSFNTLSQHSISGTVNDIETQESLPGVTIYISDLKTGAITDINGHFTIKNLKPGIYILEISYTSYKSVMRKINLSEDTTLHFSLSPSITELNEVVITGVARTTKIKQSPIIIKTINTSTLHQISATNLVDLLKNVPGISQITTGAAISKPTIRGMGFNRIITLNNNIRQEGQQWGDEHGIEIDEYTVSRVEIIKGPGSLMYGSDGIAGVLNFMPHQLANKGEIRNQLITNYQHNNHLIGYSLLNSGNKNDFYWSGRFSNKTAANYQNKIDGKVLNSAFREINGSLFLGTNKNWGHTHLTISSFNSNLGIIEGDRDSLGNFTSLRSNGRTTRATNQELYSFKIGFPNQRINHQSITSNNYLIFNKGTLNANFGFQNNLRREYTDPSQSESVDLSLRLNTFTYNLKYNIDKVKGWETSLGTSGMQQSNTNKGDEYLIPDYQLFDVGFFVFTQKIFDQLTLSAGVRFDNRHIRSKELYLDSLEHTTNAPDESSELKFSAFRKNYNGISGSVGMSYQASSSTTLKLNVSRGFRAPNIAELASNGHHHGTFRNEIGSPSLNSEISHQIDLGFYANSKHINFEITPFINFINNYIYLERQDKTEEHYHSHNHPIDTYTFTSGRATLMGGEIYLDIHPHPLDWLHIENSFSYVRAVQQDQVDSLKHLPYIPAPKYRGEIKAELIKSGKTLSNLYINLNINYHFKQNKIFTAYKTETPTDAYTLIGAGIGTSIRAFDRKEFLNLYINADNLADVAYQNHLSRLKYAPKNLATGQTGVFNMGRNFSIKAIFNF